jgi:hypothetical protein
MVSPIGQAGQKGDRPVRLHPATTNDLDDDPGAYLERLRRALCEQGLQVRLSGSVLAAVNPAVAGRLSPGLGQKVLLGDLNGDGFCWYWIWPALRPSVPDARKENPEIEFICAASEIDHAARLIAKVVRLRDEEPIDV